MPDTGCEVAGPCKERQHSRQDRSAKHCRYNQQKAPRLFGHVVRLNATTPAHRALCQVVAMKGGQRPGINWRRPPGRPQKTWIQQIGNGTPASWRQMWQSAEKRGHCEESPQRTSAIYASWWWWRLYNLLRICCARGLKCGKIAGIKCCGCWWHFVFVQNLWCTIRHTRVNRIHIHPSKHNLTVC